MAAMSVLIGLIDQEIASTEAVYWETNRIGGAPVWLSLQSSSGIPACKICGQATTLVTQLYCPLGNSAYHRCLYVFVCLGECSKQQKGWRVFRGMKYDESYSQAQHTSRAHKVGGDQWTDDQDNWGDDADDWGDNVDDWGEGTAVAEWHENPDEFKQNQGNVGRDFHPGLPSICTETPTLAQTVTDKPENQTDAPTEAFHELKISGHGDQICDSNASTESLGTRPSSAGSLASQGCEGENAEHVMEEDIGLTDAERWNAMARLLNTKHQADDVVAPVARSRPQGSVTFKSYYLSVVDEPGHNEDVSDHIAELMRNYERSEGKQLASLLTERPKSARGGAGPTEAYEKTELRHGDKMFHKFLKRLQRCPQQCIRYERGGQPLLVSKLEGQSVEQCPHCGADRLFEVQLLPPLIPWLKTEDGTEVDFGTVLIFTCKNNCWPADLDPSCHLDLVEEFVLLQADPDHHLYR